MVYVFWYYRSLKGGLCMPWEETMDQRIRALMDVLDNGFSKVSVCEDFGISRPTLDKWLKRYEEEGVEGLRDRPRAPHQHPNAVDADTEEMLVTFRRNNPHRGPRKIKVELQRDYPDRKWPASSTIAEILDRHGLTLRRKRKRTTEPYTKPFAQCKEPNDVWCIDFKGWFLTGDGERCDPLTVTDASTRYLIRCIRVARTDFTNVKAVLEAAFREYGLPLAIRSDNGPPFATRAPLGLSKLSVWWTRLGIIPERIEPGKPQQNGRHERMHLTLKQCTATPPKASLRAQQRAFRVFQQDYNHRRPHEALGQRPPGELYRSSPRPYPRRIPEISYPSSFVVRRVDKTGVIYWHQARIFISEAVAGEPVGLLALDERYYRLFFGKLELGVVDTYHGQHLRGKAAAKVLTKVSAEG
jgi:transposase InsO family protein